VSNIIEILNKQKIIIESDGHKVAYICLYGSQNYGLDLNNDEYQSDIDMKAIIVPTLEDLINNSKPLSVTIKTEWGECDVKDIRIYFETLLKANPAYIETLFTKYFVIDEDFKQEFDEIHSLAESLVNVLRTQFIRATYGMMCEKEKAMCHPYPSIAHKIEKFGYDGKQSHHIQRLWLLMIDYFFMGCTMSESIFPPTAEKVFLMDLKLNKYSLIFAKEHVGKVMGYAKDFKDEIISGIDESIIDYSIKDNFLNLSKQIIRNKITNEIRGK